MTVLQVPAECNVYIWCDVRPLLKTAPPNNQCNHQISAIIFAPFHLSESGIPWFLTENLRKRYKNVNLVNILPSTSQAWESMRERGGPLSSKTSQYFLEHYHTFSSHRTLEYITSTLADWPWMKCWFQVTLGECLCFDSLFQAAMISC